MSERPGLIYRWKVSWFSHPLGDWDYVYLYRSVTPRQIGLLVDLINQADQFSAARVEEYD